MLGLLKSLVKFYCLLVIGAFIFAALGAAFSPIIGGAAQWIDAIPREAKEWAIVTFWAMLVAVVAMESLGLLGREAAHQEPTIPQPSPLQPRDQAPAQPSVIDVEYEAVEPASSRRQRNLLGSERG